MESTVTVDEATEKKDLMRVRSRIINELIHKLAQLLENTMALGLPLSQMGGVVRASISAAYDTLREEIAEAEAHEERDFAEVCSRTITSPQFADDEARDQLSNFTNKQFESKFKSQPTRELREVDVTRRKNRKLKQSKLITSSGIKRFRKLSGKD